MKQHLGRLSAVVAAVVAAVLGGAVLAVPQAGASSAVAFGTGLTAMDLATGGYWQATPTGAVAGYGAPTYGSMAGKPLNKPIVGIEATPNDQGYWLVAADGGVFSFGNAQFYGSMGGKHMNAPVVGMVATQTGGGYWLAGADGGVFTFGNAPFLGSLVGQPHTGPIAGIITSQMGWGYQLLAQNGRAYAINGPQSSNPIWDSSVSCTPTHGTDPQVLGVQPQAVMGAVVEMQCSATSVQWISVGPVRWS